MRERPSRPYPRSMDLRRLQHLRLAAEAGSLSAAAARLGLSQPALTKSIRQLEEELGVPLLERRARGVVPTAYGEALLRRTHRVGALLDDALREIAALRGGVPDEAVIGAGPTWLREALPEVIAEAVRDRPGLRVRVEAGFDDGLLRSLRNGGLDAVVAELPSADEAADLDVLPLTTDDLVVVCRRDHPLSRRRRPVEPASLLTYPWALAPRGSRARTRLAALFGARDLAAPEPALETSSTALLLRFLAASDGLGLLARATLRGTDAAGLAALDVPDLAVSRRSGIVTRRGAWLPASTRDVLSRLLRRCGQSIPEGYGNAP